MTHFDGTGFVGRAKVRVRQQRRFWVNAKALHLLGGHDGDFCQLLCSWIVVHMGINQKNLPIGQ